MDIDSSSSPQFFVQPAIRSYRFLAGTILLGLNVAGGVLMLVRHLNGLPFGAAGVLVTGIVLLVGSWRFALRRHEQISILIVGEREPAEKLVKAVLSASAEVIETGFLLTNIVVLMLLAALVQVLAAR